MDKPTGINGVLLLYRHPLWANATTIMEHVNAFQQHSRFGVWSINTELGFPAGLRKLEYQIVVLHYSLFGSQKYFLDELFLDFLFQSRAYKVAFFQDEYQYCQQRFAFLDRYRIDCVFTLVEPEFFKDVYLKYTHIPRLETCLPSYVSDGLIRIAAQLTTPDEMRGIDIGYRGRNLEAYYSMGRGAREKSDIAVGFCERAKGLGLKLDIEFEEHKRIYGLAWYRFLLNCRAVLGVEAGVSIFDTNDIVRLECERMIGENPRISFEEASEKFLNKWEGNIPYRTISPRHFEAAALHTCQILFEGKYSGIMQPMVHYIPLKKDWSNFDDVIRMFKDNTLRRELTENAYNDLIVSGRYAYQKMVERFDEVLFQAGLKPSMSQKEFGQVTDLMAQDYSRRHFWAIVKSARNYPFPGRQTIVRLIKSALKY